jgi:hypothetical protein
MATIPIALECSKDSGFVMDPNENKRVGYIIGLKGFKKKAFAPDLNVCVPYNAGANVKPEYSEMSSIWVPGGDNQPGSAPVVGVIEKFEWAGGVGDPLKFEFYVSQENAMEIKTMQQSAIQTTRIDGICWWIADYDQELKKWFEQCHVIGTGVTAIVTGKENPELDADLTPVPAKDGIDVNVYKITLGIVPAANKRYSIHFANSALKKVAKPWGLEVGTMAKTELSPTAVYKDS